MFHLGLNTPQPLILYILTIAEEEKKEEDIREEDEDIPGTLEEQPEEKDKPTEIREEEARPTAFTEEPEEKAGDITGIIDLEKLLEESTDVEAEKEKAKEKKAVAT